MFGCFTLLLVLTGKILGLNNNLVVQDKVSGIPVEFLKQLSDSYLIIHFDNTTANDVIRLFGSYLSEAPGTYLINYDVNETYNRVMAHSYVNIVFLGETWDFAKFSSVPYNLRTYDVVFILATWTIVPVVNNWHKYGVHMSAALFLFNFYDDELYVCCYYCGENTGVNRRISRKSKISNIKSYINDFTNFHGHEFLVAHPAYPPFFYCPNNDNDCWGSEAYVLETLSKYLNFTYKLVRWQRSPLIGMWDALVFAVHNREVDWAIGGITVSLARATITDFTRALHREGFTIAYAVREDHFIAIEKFLFILHWQIYLCCFLTVALITIMAIKYNRIAIRDLDKIARIVRLASEGLLDQSSSSGITYRAFKNMKFFKWVFALWWVLSVILTSFYKSQLASILIKPTIKEPNNLDDMIAAGYKFQCDKDGGPVLKEIVVETGLPVFNELLNNLNTDLFFCESIRLALNDKIGVIDEETPAQHKAYLECDLTSSERSSLRLGRDNIFPGGYHAWSMQEAAPFRGSFTQTISRLDDVGLLEHWYVATRIYKISRSNEENLPTTVAPLNLWNLLPAYFFLLFGLLVAFMIFVVENIVHKSRPVAYQFYH